MEQIIEKLKAEGKPFIRIWEILRTRYKGISYRQAQILYNNIRSIKSWQKTTY